MTKNKDPRMELAHEIEAAFGHLNEILLKASENNIRVDIDITEIDNMSGVKRSIISATMMEVLIRT